MDSRSERPRIFERRSQYDENLVYRVIVQYEDDNYVYGKAIGWLPNGEELPGAYPRGWFEKWGFVEVTRPA